MALLIFDLDGTLIDSKRDLVNSVNGAREYMGLGLLDDATIASYVGNGAPVLMRRMLGPDASEPDVEKALEYFLKYYREHMLDYTRLYPGVRETIDELRERGDTMAVLTNKPVRFSKAILDGLGVGSHFVRVYGGNSFEWKKPHPVGIHSLVSETGIPVSATVMVGDSYVDVQTARNAGVLACGVTYGFQPESLGDPRPDFLIDRMQDLVPVLETLDIGG